MGIGARLRMMIGLASLAATASAAVAGPPERATLREAGTPPGRATHATIELKADGTFRPAAAPGAPESKPLALKVVTRIEFDERTIALGANNGPRRTIRQMTRAAATIDGEVRPSESALRAEVATLIADRRDRAVAVVSVGGPLTRAELELVQGPGDPLALPAFLPAQPVAVGDHWTVGELAARNLSGYDALAANTLEATLEALDEASARVRLIGSIRGAALGGEGSMAVDGTLTFDRRLNRVTRLIAHRAETRRPGPVEAGLDVKSTLDVARADAPAEGIVADDALIARVAAPEAAREDLLFDPPGGKYTFAHDRDWHLYWDDARQVILKRLNHGELVAQCNLAVGPNAGKGRHQDTDQFVADIRRALADRFVRIVDRGEVPSDPGAGFRYRVTIQGKQGDVGVVWHYWLIANDAGDQLIATFTLGLPQQAQFADQDQRLVGSLRWK